MRRTDKLWGGFSLIQDDRFFKLGQDTMLLSDFACPPARGSIMDLGCGNGALSVLLCARHPHITVTGLEIQPEVAALAKENITHNGLEQRMRVICGDMKQSQSLFSTGSFDYVVCNPPYFAQNSGFSAKGVNKSTARQDSSGTAADAVRAAAYLVKFGGRAAFVYRPERVSARYQRGTPAACERRLPYSCCAEWQRRKPWQRRGPCSRKHCYSPLRHGWPPHPRGHRASPGC